MADELASPGKSGHGTHDNITIEGEGRAENVPSGFRFGRMFPYASQHPVILKLRTCRTIGRHMTAQPEQSREESDVPAGYTYFGQFVDHDISFDGTANERDDRSTDAIEPTPLADLMQERSPTLDLDSLYGSAQRRNDEFFDGPKFKIGLTTGSGGGTGPVGSEIGYDLPRKAEVGPGGAARIALIGDKRNDENLAVAQTHLMWLKFHNHVVDKVASRHLGHSEAMVFEMARDLVTKHYQYVVLNDFVRRYIQPDVFEDVIVKGNRKILHHCPGEYAFMPLEFSVAAYRHGHSQVREQYDWNVNFGPEGDVFQAPFSLLFQFSELSGNLGGNPTLPTNWIADFRRLYDFSDRGLPNLEGSRPGTLNFTKAIDPYIASALGALPEIQRMIDDDTVPADKKPPSANLATLNLRRGSMRGLPSGQDVSRELKTVKMLTRAQMKGVIDAKFDEAMEENGLYDRTPLWLYILLEAAFEGKGNKLGTMGSIITAETFLTLVTTSRTSILKPGAVWTPEDAQEIMEADEPLNTIPAILAWMDELDPIIDPLQDKRLNATS